jgi:ATP-dependent RNA helicase RhlE
MTHRRHHLPEEPDPNDVADGFGVDPAQERGGETPRGGGGGGPGSGPEGAGTGDAAERPIGEPSSGDQAGEPRQPGGSGGR